MVSQGDLPLFYKNCPDHLLHHFQSGCNEYGKAIKERKLKFFPSFLWLSTTIFNEMDEFRIGFKEMADGFSSFLD